MGVQVVFLMICLTLILGRVVSVVCRVGLPGSLVMITQADGAEGKVSLITASLLTPVNLRAVCWSHLTLPHTQTVMIGSS